MTKIYAYFVITGFDGSPEKITDILGMQPDSSASKGERSINSQGREFEIKDAFWEIKSRVRNSYSLDEYIEDLVRLIKPAAHNFLSIRKILSDDVLFKIVVVVQYESGKSLPGMYLQPHTTKFLSDHNIVLEIDMN